jgi:hypothetical protein
VPISIRPQAPQTSPVEALQPLLQLLVEWQLLLKLLELDRVLRPLPPLAVRTDSAQLVEPVAQLLRLRAQFLDEVGAPPQLRPVRALLLR